MQDNQFRPKRKLGKATATPFCQIFFYVLKSGKFETENEYGNFFAPVISVNQHREINSKTWLLDSAASRHLCTNKN